ncbi:MAG: hypothetical protein JWQ76_2436 [Ramlibacter sp.]|nr:hypothetical protein [Ramlibacter sp.]
MKRTLLLVVTALSLASAAVHAETPDPSGQFAVPVTHSKSRAQVLAELKEAQRTGDILAAGDQGVTLHDLNPRAYPPHPALAGKTREQVRAETLEAIRDGDVIIQGELGLPERELYPQRYLAQHGSGSGEHTASTPFSPGQSAH